MSKLINKKALGIIALALVCVMAGTVIGASVKTANAENTQTVIVTSPFTEAIAKVRDSVVGVNNYQLVSYNNGYGNGGSSFDIYGFPWSYFGYGNGNGYGNGYGNNQPNSQEVKYGSGSGVVVADKYVLTNYHVVDGASSLKISIGDDDENLLDATVAAYNEDEDVAVLYVPDLMLDPVVLGDSDDLQIGDWVVNIGNAKGFVGSATAGIVSGLNREIPGDGKSTDKYGRATRVVNTMIQTDAAINSGNSGGGMFNTAGELVGIPTLKYVSNYTESIGMCIPINTAKPVIEEAMNKNTVTAQAESGSTESADTDVKDLKGKPRMGVTVTTVTGSTSGLPNGAYIISVEENSPAEKAGLQAGDIIVELNGEVVGSVTDEIRIMDGMSEGQQVSVKVFRPTTVQDAERGRISTDGNYVDLTVILALVDGVAQ